MEELRRLSIQYYQNTVGIRFFGIKGGIFLIFSTPFLLISLYLDFELHAENIMLLPISVCVFLWAQAKKEYDQNLIRHLSFYSHLESKKVSDHKALYLHELTYHVAPSLFETMKIFKEIVETNNKNGNFVLDNIGYHFSKFLYDPESKSRILSLIIYLISLIAILTVIKPESQYSIYQVMQDVPWDVVQSYFLFSLFFIIFGYFLIVLPIMFIVTYVAVPILLKFSSLAVLSRFFISELNRYSYLEQKIQSTSVSN
ncbi:hypothetical protein [Methylobacter sp.]|uniref:hypothetical protein n=1 Tax=Methylobacter sp. TaxID=2051955 RepID=UPI0011FA49B6|nr:hypothetical protein [Methylobacter sp.]TAK61073.1 MAG: hypothetical protein EPO18_15230 [Methylobacter sp.]